MTEFITTPTEEWLRTAGARCHARVLISSPYIGPWLLGFLRSVPIGTRKLLLTRADIRDFASGASDLESVCKVAENGAQVIVSHRLHAKVYVFDESLALVTSANATHSGMTTNLECGVVLNDADSVNTAARLVLSGFGAKSHPQKWSVSELEALREPVTQLKQTLGPRLVIPDFERRQLPNIDPSGPVGKSLQAHLAGWTRLALTGVQMQPDEVFDLATFVLTCTPIAVQEYPNNRHIAAKLRQQLQRLRDLGLIDFLGNGLYRRHI